MKTLSLIVLAILLVQPTIAGIGRDGTAQSTNHVLTPTNLNLTSYETEGVFPVSDTPPTAADLAFNNDTLPLPALRALAGNLSHDALNEFLFVRNTIYYDPYDGSMKGAYMTYADSAGNDVDQASLLITLLRLSGIPARYVFGNVTLTAPEVANWEGFTTGGTPMNSTQVFAAIDVLYGAGIPYHVTYTNSSYDSAQFNIEQTWVEAYVNGAWIQMDPSFKQYYDYAPVDWSAISSLASPNLNGLSSTGAEDAIQDMSSGLSTYASENPSASMGNLLASAAILNSTNYAMPADSTRSGSSPSLSNSVRWYLQVTFPNYLPSENTYAFSPGYSISIPTTLAGTTAPFLYGLPNSSTLAYIDGFPQGIYDPSIDLSRVDMRAALSLNGTFLMQGDLAPVGSTMPISLELLLNGTQVAAAGSGVTHYDIGEVASLYVSCGHDWSPSDPMLENTGSQYTGTLSFYSQGNSVTLSQLFGSKFSYAGRLYYRELDLYQNPLAKSLNIVEIPKIGVALIGFYLFLGTSNGNPIAYFGGEHIDIQVGGYYSYQYDNQTAAQTWYGFAEGYFSSYFEGATMEATTWTTPISTVSVFVDSQQEGIPIVTLSPSNYTQLSALNLPSSVKSDVESYLTQGNWVEIPDGILNTTSLRVDMSTSPVAADTPNTWAGTGFLVFNPTTGDFGPYVIYGVGVSDSPGASSGIAGGASGTTGPTINLYSTITNWLNGENNNNQIYVTAICGVRGAPLGGSPLEDQPSCQGVSTALEDEDGAVALQSSLQSGYDDVISDPSAQVSVALSATTATAGSDFVLGVDALGWSRATLPSSGSLVGAAVSSIGTSLYKLWSYLITPAPVQDAYDEVNAVRGSPRLAGEAGNDPGVNLYITDSAGRTSGYLQDPFDNASPSTQFYSGAATVPQQVWLFEPAAGTYSVSIVNDNSSAVQLYGTISWSTSLPYPVPSQKGTATFGALTIMPGVTMTASLTISESNGVESATLGTFKPASFTKISAGATPVLGRQAIISGNVTGDDGVTPLVGQPVDLLYRAAGALSSPWTLLGTATTTVGGTFSLPWTPAELSTFDILAAYSGEQNVFGSNETTVTVVQAYLNVTASSLGQSGGPLQGLGIAVLGSDGTAYSSLTGSGGVAAFLLPAGEYTVNATSVRDLTQSSRLVFAGWTDGVTTSTREIQFAASTGLGVGYQLQYSLYVIAAPNTGGTVSSPGNWLDANSSVSLMETAAKGWQFEGWSGAGKGSYTGSNGIASFTLDGPTNETATFYPGLTLSAGTGGTISYTSSASSGTIQAGRNLTVYFPAGTSVTLVESASTGYGTSGWMGGGSGSYSGGGTVTTVVVAGPLSEAGGFSPLQSSSSSTTTSSSPTDRTSSSAVSSSSTTSSTPVPEIPFPLLSVSLAVALIVASLLSNRSRKATRR